MSDVATSYRKIKPLDPQDFLVFDKVPPVKPQPEKLPQLAKLPQLDAPPRLHDISALLESLGKLGKLTPKDIQPGDTFTLSPRQPYIENRGSLEVLNALLYVPDVPNIQFIDSFGGADEARYVQVWLRGLTPGHSYIAQIRVQAGGNGTFQVSTGEGGRQTSPGGDRTIPVLLSRVGHELSLIRVINLGASYWAFVDVTVTAIGQV